MDYFTTSRNNAPLISASTAHATTKTNTPMRQFLCAAMLATCGLAGPFLPAAHAAADTTPPSVATTAMQKPAQPESIVMVPDEFLRPWDPVTLFFPASAPAPGPTQGGPEDRPEQWVTLEPAHPGGWTWLDNRTLQFRPTIAWPPLQRFNWSFAGESLNLATLLAPPQYTTPRANAVVSKPLRSIELNFAEPLDETTLTRLLRIELSKLPGIGDQPGAVLSRDDFAIKPLQRQSASDGASYVINLQQPLPAGQQVRLRLPLSLPDANGGKQAEPADDRSGFTLAFRTAPAFRITHFGCADSRYPVAPGGVQYGEQEALRCSPNNRQLSLRFSATPQALDAVAARNLVRISPPVANLNIEQAGQNLLFKGDFATDQLYQMALQPWPLKDIENRALQMASPSSLFLHFPRPDDRLSWGTGHGIVERFGPQTVPVSGRGFTRADLRIHRIDPLSRALWPFPNDPVAIDENRQPPGPGEAPTADSDLDRPINSYELSQQLRLLGSPSLSRLIDLPLTASGPSARFGLDMQELLQKISGQADPGHYLLGLRKLDNSSQRQWLRLQVTDLSLSVVESPDGVQFAVTSLQTALPVANASVTLEGVTSGSNGSWVKLFSGRTNAAGMVDWQPQANNPVRLRRIHVSKGGDSLLLDPDDAPEKFFSGRWQKDRGSWLVNTKAFVAAENNEPEPLCHLFTERPVYRPDQTVHLKGYIRNHQRGRLSIPEASGRIVITTPDDNEYPLPVQVTEYGSFTADFNEADLPTGDYTARFEYGAENTQCGRVSFNFDAYKLPRFEVQLQAADIVPLDEPFDVSLAARYYAGGDVAGQQVNWRVLQFPSDWTPSGHAGFRFSSDSRFSGGSALSSEAVLEVTQATDENGSASISINPALEPSAAPRRYIIESTVVGADETISATRQVRALPAFVLGVKVPRFLPDTRSIDLEVLAVGPDDAAVAGKAITVRLLHRQWHSYLQAADFAGGQAKYVTEVVDEPVRSINITSTGEAKALSLPIDDAGVYVVELEARDQLGRAQVVKVDLYAGGDTPVTWSQPPSRVFSVTSNQPKYAPGETATLLLESPFQEAQALAVIETPDGNRYQWLAVRDGVAKLDLPIQAHWTPRLPVHLLLMRGRLAGEVEISGGLDLGKPVTLAATQWLAIDPVKNRIDVQLEYPEKALPGSEIEFTIQLTDDEDKPLAGEVTLWLVDQAVLALGTEQRLNMLPDFIRDRGTRTALRDTRNSAFGFLPFIENPGGDGGGAMDEALLDNVTIRKNFQPVPYFNPSLLVDASGTATVRIKLPDNLTNFKIRAKAVAGTSRFGIATGSIAVRLPVIVQPALPRFLRNGDVFTALAIGRVVEGDGGKGKVEIKVEGAELQGDSQRALEWETKVPQRIEFPVRVPASSQTEGGQVLDSIAFTVAVERSSDSARDAFRSEIPLLADRQPERRQQLLTLDKDNPIALPSIDEPLRAGSFRRELQISGEAALLKMASGLQYLQEYPHGCTEQRVSRLRAMLAWQGFTNNGDSEDASVKRRKQIEQQLLATQDWIRAATDDNGLVGYWPGARGQVWLTAWSYEMLLQANGQRLDVDTDLRQQLERKLKQSLRSDSGNFLDGAALAERSWAMAALAAGGELDSAYTAEFARSAKFLPLENLAQATRLLNQGSDNSSNGSELTVEKLRTQLWQRLVFQLYQGEQRYAGLQNAALSSQPQILPSETRSLAQVLRAVSDDTDKRRLMVDAIVRLADASGWGDTNTNAAAILALTEFMQAPADTSSSVTMKVGTDEQQLEVGATAGLITQTLLRPDAVSLSLLDGQSQTVRVDTRYLPTAAGSDVAANAQGLVVDRRWSLIQTGAEAGAPAIQRPLDTAGTVLNVEVGQIVEERVQLVNSQDRTHVAIVIPLAAGMQPLNPRLATAPPEAKPTGELTLAPSYIAMLDDRVTYYYNELPKGSYSFYFRTRATTPGQFSQPPAFAELMYQQAIRGRSNAARVSISTAP